MLIAIFHLFAAMVFLAGFGVCTASDITFSSVPRVITFDRMLPTASTKLIAQVAIPVSTRASAASSLTQNRKESTEQETRVVQSGDTLIGLFGIRQYRLVAEFNSIANPDRIFVGQVLRLPPGITHVPLSAKRAATVKAVAIAPIRALPEYVETQFGTAWVYPGTNRAETTRETLAWSAPDIAASTMLAMKRWISTNQISEEAQESLIDRIAENDRTVVTLTVGDRYDAMLFAGNDYREQVLAAWSEQRHYHGLCYGVRVRNMDYLMIRELASGNWIFHSLPTTGTEENIACERLRRSL
ncbi:MAG TPA: LysM peptidoglycan-binding domain-containing protein [Candidatus Paceibacterota bacterium]|nr:LysM peptidoglycan-binding domain-containing protein [Candidatus Paceibacterota bacterium]